MGFNPLDARMQAEKTPFFRQSKKKRENTNFLCTFVDQSIMKSASNFS